MSANRNVKLDCRQRGFSLLETIIAVAIVSAASVVMFQTISVQFRFAERADAAVERGLSALSAQSMTVDLVAGLTPGWEERGTETFQGNARQFSGLTRNALHTSDEGMMEFTLELAETDGVTALSYASGDIVWELMRLAGTDYAFSYRGVDLIWRSEWPPRARLDLPPFDDGAGVSPPALPRAIRLAANAGTGDEQIVWLAAIDWRHGAVPRLDSPAQ